MKLEEINLTGLIAILENVPELFRLKKYKNVNFVKKHIALFIHRNGFYGTKNSIGELTFLNRSKTNFISDKDVTILIEGVVSLPKAPTITGTGSIIYEGYGLLEVDGAIIYDGRAGDGIITSDEVINNSTVFGATVTEALNTINIDLTSLQNSTFKVTYYEIIDISSGTSGSLSSTPTSGTILTGDEFGESGEAVLSTTTGGQPTYETPKNGTTPITVTLDGSGNWISSDVFPSPVALIYKFIIQLSDWSEVAPSFMMDYYKDGLDSNEIGNASSVAGSTVTEALDNLDTEVSGKKDDFVASNGLTEGVGTLKLGGTLTENTSIEGSPFINLNLGTVLNPLGGFNVNSGVFGTNLIAEDSLGVTSRLDILGNQLVLRSDATVGVVTDVLVFSVDALTGATYGGAPAPLTANLVNESIPAWTNVLEQITASLQNGNGTTYNNTTNAYDLGGTLTSDVTIEGGLQNIDFGTTLNRLFTFNVKTGLGGIDLNVEELGNLSRLTMTDLQLNLQSNSIKLDSVGLLDLDAPTVLIRNDVARYFTSPLTANLINESIPSWANVLEQTIPEAPNDGQQYARQSEGWTVVAGAGGLSTKSGSVTAVSFTGNPKVATVTFATAFVDLNYTPSVIGQGTDNYNITVESVAAGSFVINLNSNQAPTNNLLWTAIKHGES